MSKTFSHLNNSNNPTMVDVGYKAITHRIARAQSTIKLSDEIWQHWDGEEINGPKGAIFQTAILAGVMGAKKTSELIPLCHVLLIEKVDVTIKADPPYAIVTCEVSVTGKTGVEMEALTGATIAALTIYDMCKAFGHDLEITSTKLISKKGGKSDYHAS